jgi:plasmid stabilization system protein ParE
MEIRWEPRALAAVEQAIDYRREVAGKWSALRLKNRIIKTAGRLAAHPQMGPVESNLKGLSHSYRSVVADKNFKLIYRIEGDVVYISALFDCRRNPISVHYEVKG